MASIQSINVSLRILGDDLDPEGVSALLGMEPTHGRRKGDAVDGDALPAATGAWILESSLPETAEIEEHVSQLLAPLSGDLDEWGTVTTNFSADMRCDLTLGNGSEAFDLSPRLAQSLAERGIVISFHITGS